jgi:hypothetical protein
MRFVGCREEVCPRNIYPDGYVLDNGVSYSWLPSDIDQAFWFVFPKILVLILMPMMDDLSNGCMNTRSLGTSAEIKIMG